MKENHNHEEALEGASRGKYTNCPLPLSKYASGPESFYAKVKQKSSPTTVKMRGTKQGKEIQKMSQRNHG